MWPMVQRKDVLNHDRTVMLCVTCWRYLPLANDRYWRETKRELLEEEDWEDYQVDHLMTSWRTGESRQCPKCYTNADW